MDLHPPGPGLGLAMPKSYPTKLPHSLRTSDLEAVLTRVGGTPFKGRNHTTWRFPTGTLAAVPLGRRVEQGELHNTLKVAGISREEFFRLLLASSGKPSGRTADRGPEPWRLRRFGPCRQQLLIAALQVGHTCCPVVHGVLQALPLGVEPTAHSVELTRHQVRPNALTATPYMVMIAS